MAASMPPCQPVNAASLLEAIKSGNIPIFDDVDFSKLRGFFGSNLGSLEQNLGDTKLAELQDAV